MTKMAEKIKEILIEMNTLDSGIAEHITDIINGYLECFIVKTNKQIDFEIRLDTYPEIVLFSYRSMRGTSVIPLRFSAIDYRGERFNFSQLRYPLNDKLVFEVRGEKYATVQISMRYN